MRYVTQVNLRSRVPGYPTQAGRCSGGCDVSFIRADEHLLSSYTSPGLIVEPHPDPIKFDEVPHEEAP